jgi:hypothetical protein
MDTRGMHQAMTSAKRRLKVSTSVTGRIASALILNRSTTNRLPRGCSYPAALLASWPRHRVAQRCEIYVLPAARYRPLTVETLPLVASAANGQHILAPKPEPRWDLHGPRSGPCGFHLGIAIVLQPSFYLTTAARVREAPVRSSEDERPEGLLCPACRR